MSKRIIIVGSGFAGFWAALSARRLASLSHEKGIPGVNEVEVVVITPDTYLVIRPRLYEADPANKSAPVDAVYSACDVRFVHGIADTIRTGDHEIETVDHAGVRSIMSYDKLIRAAGSHAVHPDIPGLIEYGFSVDQMEVAVKLDKHLHSLASKPASKARNTSVVGGGGFTGIEVGTELVSRLRRILGEEAEIRVIIVEQGRDALTELRIETTLETSIIGIEADGVVLSSGERIETFTTIWTAGVRATPLTMQVPGEKDSLGRLVVNQDLRVSSEHDVFAAGDAACAVADRDHGYYTRMSCQHAIPLGKIAGHNAMADLLGVSTIPYFQPMYIICLDLGATGSLVGGGWETNANSQYAGPKTKTIKQFINNELIYPPGPNAAEAFMAADLQADYTSLLHLFQKLDIAV